jgi:hypothetical protein
MFFYSGMLISASVYVYGLASQVTLKRAMPCGLADVLCINVQKGVRKTSLTGYINYGIKFKVNLGIWYFC